MKRKYLSLREVSEITGYSINSLRNWIRNKQLKTYRPTPRSPHRIKIKDLDRFMESGSNIMGSR